MGHTETHTAIDGTADAINEGYLLDKFTFRARAIAKTQPKQRERDRESLVRIVHTEYCLLL